MGFKPGHVVAFEFYAVRDLAAQCKQMANPVEATQAHKAAAEEYGTTLVEKASQSSNDNQMLAAVQISGALGILADDLVAEVKSRVRRSRLALTHHGTHPGVLESFHNHTQATGLVIVIRSNPKL